MGLMGWLSGNILLATENPEDSFIKPEPNVTQSTILVNIASTLLQIKNISTKILQSAQGIVIIPKMTTAGLLVTASQGDGIVLVRQDGHWSNPVLVTLTGAGAGLKAGVKSSSIILIFTHRQELDKLLAGHLKLGTSWSIAVGTHRQAAEATNLVTSSVYDYSDELGLFAGIGIEGTSLRPNPVMNEGLYGRADNLGTLLSASLTPLTDIAKDAVNNLNFWLTIKTNQTN